MLYINWPKIQAFENFIPLIICLIIIRIDLIFPKKITSICNVCLFSNMVNMMNMVFSYTRVCKWMLKIIIIRVRKIKKAIAKVEKAHAFQIFSPCLITILDRIIMHKGWH